MDTNPYQPPSSSSESLTLWDVLRYLFASKRQRALSRFANGYAILFEGISFFVLPENPAYLYAASPSSNFSDDRMNLIVSEVIRLLPIFLADHSYLQDFLAGRKIVARMIESYDNNQAEFIRETSVDLNLLDFSA